MGEITLTFSFIVPTHRDDRPLRRCLNSLVKQLSHGDEVIIAGDTHSSDLPGTQDLVHEYDRAWPATFKFAPYNAGHHCWGHCQVNNALTLATGDYIHLNDDDDVWSDNAVELMSRGARTWPNRILLFRFQSYYGRNIYWTQAGRMERDWIGGHCLVTPNDQAKLGRFTCAYNGDFDYIEQTVNAFGGPGQAIWISDIVAIARP